MEKQSQRDRSDGRPGRGKATRRKERASGIVHVQSKEMLSRLLYTNPVCLLSTGAHDSTGPANIMVISWLTPLTNQGLLLLSVNERRHTATKLRACPAFVLNVPVSGSEDRVLAIGKCNGRDVNKITQLGIDLCSPGWTTLGENASLVAVPECICHIVCEVLTMENYEGHWLVKAQINDAWVRTEYWAPNGQLVPSEPTVPPYLTFLGSQRFAYVVSKPFPIEGKKQEEQEPIQAQKLDSGMHCARQGLLSSVALVGTLCFLVGYTMGRRRMP